jgi:glutaredoxin
MTRTLTLYSRAGCHLCEQMLAQLAALNLPNDVSLITVDVDADPALHERFNVKVPVLALDDEILCCHFLDENELRQALIDG